MKKVKALVLLSGGLDSMLAAKVLAEQGIEVTGISFISCFFGAGKAEKAAAQLDIKLKKVDFKKEHLKMVKNPASGYGRNMNPCIDCHALMIRRAGEIAEKEDYNIVATGEVLGERPMSQNLGALKKVEKLAGVEVLRPLSALLLPEIEVEKRGLVNRKNLLDIKGRTRKRQLELVKKYKIKDYPSAGGGCLLTDPEFSKRLREMIANWPECQPEDIELLKHGRVFWVKNRKGENVLIIVGRNKEDCEALEKLAKKDDVVMELEKIKGPLTVVRNVECRMSNVELKIPKEFNVNNLKLDEAKGEEEILQTACLLTGWYATKARGKAVKLEVIIKE